ncbi:MAG: fibronectin type III domain-containing protein, partial [Nostocaceae cyanobacterium]|nr:fibronectin type III domain-containing protein [Nostocaceae cyanobacterium]
MINQIIKNRLLLSFLLIIGLMIPIGLGAGATAANPQTALLYQPYIQPGDASSFGSQDQIVIAWQTNESQPHPSNYKVEFSTNSKSKTVVPVGRVVDNYLAADSALPVPPTATGPRTNYYALLPNLQYNTNYTYRVTGLGLPKAGFQSTFHTRKQTSPFSFQVMGDEGFFPADPSNKPYLANYQARVVNTMYNVEHLSFPGMKLAKPDLALNTGDNVYLTGSEANYNDFWMPVWNN